MNPPLASRADLPLAAALLAEASVLDARTSDAFARGHLAGAGRIALEEFRERRSELPPRTSTVLVVHDEPDLARRTAEALAALGYPHVHWLAAPLAELAGGAASREGAAALWRPSPFLARVRDRLPGGRSLDLAAGSGRESVHLALHGWSAEAWDHDASALERASALAARCGVPLRTRVVELERGPLPDPEAGWDVILVFRFLQRTLFPWIERALAPGGMLVYETFRVGQEIHGRPKQQRFLLQPDELTRSFPGLVIEHHEESAPERGPVMAHLLARRPA